MVLKDTEKECVNTPLDSFRQIYLGQGNFTFSDFTLVAEMNWSCILTEDEVKMYIWGLVCGSRIKTALIYKWSYPEPECWEISIICVYYQ